MSLEIRNYAPIGKAVLHRIIGLQDNYKMQSCSKYCKKCPISTILKNYQLFPDTHEYQKAIDTCTICPHRDESETIYVNELNRFGSSQKLKSNAMLLFLFYHLLGPNEYGIIANIPIKLLAKKLNVAEKTIRENNKILADSGYIYISYGIDQSVINVCLTEYRSYFKAANEGGRGYLTFTKILFDELVIDKSVNLLRIKLKTLLELDDNSLTNHRNSLTKTYKELQRFLPSYCKRNVIQKLLQIGTPAFSFHYNEKTVTTILSESFNGKLAKERAFVENKTIIENTVEDINQTILANKNNLFTTYSFKEYHFNHLVLKKYVPLKLKDKDISDMTALSLQYSLEFVFRAFATIYKDYIAEDKPIQNLGGLMRSEIRKFLNTSLHTA